MKKILLLCAAVILCIFATSCRKSNPFNYVPEGAEAVMVFDLGATLNQSIDMDKLNKILAQDSCYLTDSQKDLIKEFASDPKKMGLNFLKKFVAYCDVEDDDKGNITGGLVIPVIFEKNVTEAFRSINKKFSWCNFENIKEDDGINYLYPLENEDVKNSIIGWNGKMLVWLISTRDLSSSDLKASFNMKRKETIMANSDFRSFKKKCKTVSMWMRCDAALTIAQAVGNGHVESYSKLASELKEKIKDEKSSLRDKGIIYNNLLSLVDHGTAIAEGLHESYVHSYFDWNKKYCSLSTTFVWSDKISNYEYEKIIDDVISSGIISYLLNEQFGGHGKDYPCYYNDYGYDYDNDYGYDYDNDYGYDYDNDYGYDYDNDYGYDYDNDYGYDYDNDYGYDYDYGYEEPLEAIEAATPVTVSASKVGTKGSKNKGNR